jgi:hypothetical protein
MVISTSVILFSISIPSPFIMSGDAAIRYLSCLLAGVFICSLGYLFLKQKAMEN